MHINEVVSENVPFISLTIHLASGYFTPQQDKYASFASLLRTQDVTRHSLVCDWQQVLGKVCWYASLHRPALSALSLVYKYPCHNQAAAKPTAFTVSAARRQELIKITSLIPAYAANISATSLPISVVAVVTTTHVTLLSAPLETHQCWNLWALAHRQASQDFTGRSVKIEAEEIIPYLRWSRVYTTPWKAQYQLLPLHLSGTVMALKHTIKKGFSAGFSFLISSSETASAVICKGRHSDRCL